MSRGGWKMVRALLVVVIVLAGVGVLDKVPNWEPCHDRGGKWVTPWPNPFGHCSVDERP